MKGIVEEENEQMIVLNVGFGTIKLRKEEIARIERTTAKEKVLLKEKWRDEYFMRQEFVPERLKDIASGLKRLERARGNAIRSKQTRWELSEKTKGLKATLKSLDKKTTQISKKLAVLKPKDNVNEYNAVVTEHNALIAQMQVKRSEQETLKKQIFDLGKELSQYIGYFYTFTKKLKDKLATATKGATEAEKVFLKNITKKIGDMESDFTKYKVDYQQYGAHAIVDARLNDSVNAKFIVDTGASLIMITEEIAHKLGTSLPQKGKQRTLSITLADGRKVKAHAVILKSVQVGKTYVKNVPAAVLAHSKPTVADGLLGMSFLKHFFVKLDTTNNKLILEEFNR